MSVNLHVNMKNAVYDCFLLNIKLASANADGLMHNLCLCLLFPPLFKLTLTLFVSFWSFIVKCVQLFRI